jgi:hypothetical protein
MLCAITADDLDAPSPDAFPDLERMVLEQIKEDASAGPKWENTPRRRNRRKPGDPAALIISYLQLLAKEREWGWPMEKIRKEAGEIPSSTFYKLKSKDEKVIEAFKRYHDRSLGLDQRIDVDN